MIQFYLDLTPPETCQSNCTKKTLTTNTSINLLYSPDNNPIPLPLSLFT